MNWSRKNSAQDLNGHSSSGSSSKKNVSRNLNGHGSSEQVSAVTNYFKVGNTASKNKKKNVIETELWADKHAPNNQVSIHCFHINLAASQTMVVQSLFAFCSVP